MLTPDEYNRLYRKIEELTDAWEAYVKAVADDDSSRFGKGAVVTDHREALLRFIGEDLR